MNRQEAIEAFGSVAEYEQFNREAHAALEAISKALDGHPVQAAINATVLMGMALMRVDGSNVEAALKLVREAWDSDVVRDIADDFGKGLVHQ